MERLFYLAHVFDSLWTIGLISLIVSMIAIVVFIIGKCCEYNTDEEDANITKLIKRCISIIVVSIVVLVFCPNKKTFLFMMGGKAVDELVDKTNIEELPGNTVELLNEYIKTETEKVKQHE